MSQVQDGPLSTYNSLTDTHLAGYFANNRMRRHLRKAGLVSKRGEIVSESTYRLNMSRREHKRHVKDMLAQAIVHKTLDMERSRQGEIKRKLEEIAKMQLVRRVRDERTRKFEEALLPLLSPRSNRTRTPSPQHLRSHRTSKTQSVTSVSASKRDQRDRVLYLDDEGRPITPAFSTDRRNPEQNNIDTRHLHSLDTVALRKYAQLMAQMEEGRGLTSPYMMPQVPLPPRPPSTARTPRSARRALSASPRRVVTTDSRLARLHRPETAKSHAGDQQTLCRVTMRYHGWALHLARETTDPTQEVVLEQQHCGGNTLTVFKDRLQPGSKFQFISYRHRGYPFSLSLYVDGQMDGRVSTCCEYRHSKGAKIGGKQGHFSLLKVTGAVPCYKCQVAKGVRVPSRAGPRKLKRPAEVRREEVIVVSSKDDQKDKEEIRRYQQEMMEDDNDDDDVEMIPVEPDERDEVDTQLKTAQSDDYADDFEDSQASEHSKSSSSSSSESDSETEPKEEEKRKKEKKQERATETFQPREDRGEEEEEEKEKEKEEEEEEEGRRAPLRGRDGGSGRSSARSPRIEVNGTGRQIDDYSSDNDDDGGEETAEVTGVTPYESTKLVPVTDVDDAEHTPIRSHRRVSSHSSTSSSSATEGKTRSSQDQRDAAVISVDLLDKEEKKEEDAQRERERREELRRREETDLYQQKRAEEAQRREEKKRAEEERRQEDLLRQQQRDEERRRREEQRRQEEEEENRRRQAEIDDSPEAREKQRMEAQVLRDEQIRREQQEREEKRKRLEEERDRAWKLEESSRKEKIKVQAEERERRRQEEASSSARSETSTARSTTTSASSATSSAETTPRKIPSQSVTTVEVTRADSPPTPEAAVYEDRRPLLKEPEDSSSPSPQRPTSPLPPAASYESRRRERTREQDASPARPVSPFPPAAVYEDRRAARKAEKEERDQKRTEGDASGPPPGPLVPVIPLHTSEKSEEQPPTGRSSTTDVSTTATTSEEDSDDDYHSDVSARSQESVFSVQQFSKGREREQAEDSGTADSSSDSDTSSDNDDARTKNVSASSTTETADVKEGKDLASGVHATSESDGENMHGGADPDNVAQQEEAGELQPLMTKELPAAKAHSGDITDLLSESKDSVDLSNVLLNKTQVYQLGSHLEGSSGVKMVSLCNTGLDDDDLQRLAEALAASPSDPVMLNLSLNAVTPKGIQHVLHVLKAKPSIKLLILQGNPVGDAGVKELTQGLSDLHRQARAHRKAVAKEVTSDTLSVDSSFSSLDPSAMAQRYLLQELDLTDTKLTDSGAAHLAQMVASNVYVENVNLSHNSQITAGEGWRQLGEALARNRCIRTLTLDGNRIGDEGMDHLARGLRNNRALRSLTLENAGIGAAGGESLMEMLKRNTTVLELTLSPGNSIPTALAEDIGRYVALNRAPYSNSNSGGHQFGV